MLVLLPGALIINLAKGRHSRLDRQFGGTLVVGSRAPNFKLLDATRTLQSWSDIRGGSPRIIFFCGCDRCRAAAKRVAELQRSGRIGSFTCVISLDIKGAETFARETGISGKILSDPDARVAEQYDALLCPRVFAVNQDGILVYSSKELLQGDELSLALDSVR